MGGTMLGVMQGILNGSGVNTATAPGVTQGINGMLSLMTGFASTQPTTTTPGSTDIFQSMASAMTRVLTGSSTTPASVQPMLGIMQTFLSDSVSGSPNASVSFQSMIGAMQTFLAGANTGSLTTSVPFNNMLGVMQSFVTSATSGTTSAPTTFQSMLTTMSTILNNAEVLSGPASAHTINVLSNGNVQVSGTAGTQMLGNMQRLHFVDGSVALDISGNAGTTAKLLGATFGSDSVSNKAYVGMGLNLLDGGMSYQDLTQTALNAKLGTNFSTADEVKLLYQNLLGTAPSASDLNYWEGTVSSGQYTHASLAMMAADSGVNTANIHLVGMAQTGLGYVPYAG